MGMGKIEVLNPMTSFRWSFLISEHIFIVPNITLYNKLLNIFFHDPYIVNIKVCYQSVQSCWHDVCVWVWVCNLLNWLNCKSRNSACALQTIKNCQLPEKRCKQKLHTIKCNLMSQLVSTFFGGCPSLILSWPHCLRLANGESLVR